MAPIPVFFAPFEFDVTDSLNDFNSLVIEVENDAPSLGLQTNDELNGLDGDKIYAATGPGWDSSEEGWHHCPPGAGIYNSVFIEERSEYYISSSFVRPLIESSEAEVTVEIANLYFSSKALDIKLDVFPENFEGKAIEFELKYNNIKSGPGLSRFVYKLNVDEYKLWTLESPYMYKLRVSLFNGTTLIDQHDTSFGMRDFYMDTVDKPRGTLYLNNEKIILRGANTMGHMQQCVMKKDKNQLIEDILIGKLANMNFFRFTQRPVQEEIYYYCDRLGMLNQTDFPLFGYIRYNTFAECVKQAGEMEKHIKNHPSSIMVTYINEPFSAYKHEKTHRDLTRREMENLFEAATHAVHLENPDRVVKNVEGDYNPPTRRGLSDFHCYNMWYTNHALPIGKLIKGYIPAVKKGWKTGCGEYGTEGLDPIEIMMEEYPKSWIPDHLNDSWNPDKIAKAQTYSMHGDWYEEQNTITEWIFQSQKHQAEATKIMTEALRRRSDVIVSTAIHLLVDAWPAGWMKTLVDYRRNPKPAYFDFQRALKPLRINLRTDSLKAYSGELLEVEAWILNDTSHNLDDAKIIATLRNDSGDFASYESSVNATLASPTYIGSIKFQVPSTNSRQEFYIDAVLVSKDNRIIDEERLTLEAFKELEVCRNRNIICFNPDFISLFINENIKYIEKMNQAPNETDFIIIDNVVDFTKNKEQALTLVENGAKLLVDMAELREDDVISIGSKEYKPERNHGIYFVARDNKNVRTKEFGARDFYFLYNRQTDCIDSICDKYIKTDSNAMETVLFSYQKPKFNEYVEGRKKRLPVFSFIKYGKGEIILSTISLLKFKNVNPIFDKFFDNVLEYKA